MTDKDARTTDEGQDGNAIRRAAELLRAGELVAFPTETVYGLGADATNDKAVAKIFAAKGRPAFNPLISHVASRSAANALAEFNPLADRLANAFWPGPLTLVLPRLETCPVDPAATAGLDTIALRVPSHPVARALLTEFGRPVAGPSANPSGRISPTDAHHVAEDLGDRIAMVLDGGPSDIGLESTVVGFSGQWPVILRDGGISAEAIAALVGDVARPAEGVIAGPGMLASHYAPRAPVRLNANAAEPGEALLAFGPDAPKGAVATLNLSVSGDLAEAAHNLFNHLRLLDREAPICIAVMPIPNKGLGRAINDRLKRAAADR